MAWTPLIEAEATCDTGSGFMINYKATSWKTTAEGGHPQIDILLDGDVVASDPFSDPSYSFSGSVSAPKGAVEGDKVTVTGCGCMGHWLRGRTI
jgi:hypothetical protein